MCLIVFDHRPGADVPLRLVANRDEFHARPTAPLAAWDDGSGMVGGRDLQAGGSWLAVHPRGRVAAITNVRDLRHPAPDGAVSRGHLVHDALVFPDLEAWIERLARQTAPRFAAFNLLVGDGARLWHLHHSPAGVTLGQVPPGVHGLSNATLDTPWPKLVAAREALSHDLRDGTWPEQALKAMADRDPAADDRLPDTGVSLDLERVLSAPFIVGDAYGTRSTTSLSWHADGSIDLVERTYGPGGVLLRTSEQRVDVPPLPRDWSPTELDDPDRDG